MTDTNHSHSIRGSNHQRSHATAVYSHLLRSAGQILGRGGPRANPESSAAHTGRTTRKRL